MSRELKNFGFYDSKEDSVAGATNMILSGEQKQSSRIFSEPNLVEELFGSFKRYKETTDRRLHLMADEITKLNLQLKTFVDKSATTTIRNDSIPIIKSDELITSPKPVQQVLPTEKENETSKNERPYNQRQGNFTSEDVKIEDIFYFGQKR